MGPSHGVVDIRCGGCLVWWMSYFTQGVVVVWCGGCLCGGCRTIDIVQESKMSQPPFRSKTKLCQE